MSEEDENSLPPQEWVVAIKPETLKNFKAEGLSFDLSASRWAKAIANAMLKHIKVSLRKGNKPSGERQPPLAPDSSRAKKAAKGKRTKARGFTEYRIFINSLKIKSLKKSKRQASYLIGTNLPEVFDEWLLREKGRGADYFPIHGDMAKLVQDVADDLLKKAIAKRARAAAKAARGHLVAPRPDAGHLVPRR